MYIIVKAVETANPSAAVGIFQLEVADSDAETIAATMQANVLPDHEWTITTSAKPVMNLEPLAGVGESDEEPEDISLQPVE
jgi:hypothetical protein